MAKKSLTISVDDAVIDAAKKSLKKQLPKKSLSAWIEQALYDAFYPNPKK